MKRIENVDREWCAEPKSGELAKAVDKRRIDIASALTELESLAIEGSGLAMLYLGDTYANGRGEIDRDLELGKRWYRRAADSGSIEAAHRLAYTYFHEGKYQQSMEILKTLSERGFTPAMYCLGSFYFVGTGIEKNIDEAVSFWRMAENGGHIVAKRRVSIVLRSGRYGVVGIINGLAKMIVNIIPFVIYSVRNPRSDFLRNW